MAQILRSTDNIPLEDLLKRTESVYKLVALASLRAVELSRGAPPLVKMSAQQPGSVALEEIRQGHVWCEPTAAAAKESKKVRKA